MDQGIPSKIGRYVVDRLIGSGAMGFVFLGRDQELDRPVAIKTLRDLHMGKDALETFLERFRNEARAAARLMHPSIVQVYDVGQDTEMGPFLVFEYVPGSTLKQIIRSRGPLSPAHAVRLAEEVGDAIDTAHGREIIHRDIKPDNLLVAQDGRVKLADFGVARIPNAALTREGQFLGTPCYAAPETLKEAKYGPESDLFSFAAVLYEVVSGVRAFPGDDAVAVAHKVIHDQPPPPSEVAKGAAVPKEVDAVLMRALSKSPVDRHRSARELTHAFREAFEGAGLLHVDPAAATMASSVQAASPARTRERRGSGLAFAAVLAGALAVGIAIVFAFGREGTDGDPVVADGAPDAGRVDREPVGPAGGEARAPDAAAVVIGPAANDAGAATQLPSPSELTAHDREERAKDAIERAEELIARGDLAGARSAVDEARLYDAENPDIEALEARLAP